MMHRAVQHGLNDMRAAGYLGGLPPFWLHLVMDAYAKAGSQPPGAARTDQQCADRLRSRNRAQCAFWARRPGAANVALLLSGVDCVGKHRRAPPRMADKIRSRWFDRAPRQRARCSVAGPKRTSRITRKTLPLR